MRKQQRVDASEQLFNRNKKDFFMRYVTVHETCTGDGKPRPKWVKVQQSAGKVLMSIFLDVQEILFIDYLKKTKNHQ